MGNKPPKTSLTPTPKVAAVGVAGAFVVILTWMLENYTQVVLSPEVRTALTAGVLFAVGWLMPDNSKKKMEADDQV